MATSWPDLWHDGAQRRLHELQAAKKNLHLKATAANPSWAKQNDLVPFNFRLSALQDFR
jgi:hypothetical protein